MPAIVTVTLDSLNLDEYYREPFGVKGAAEYFLRNLHESGEVFAVVEYSPAVAQSLRNAAKKTAAEGLTFTFEKIGRSYRDVVYNVTRGEKTYEIHRKFLNTEGIVVTSVQNEADAAIAADAS